MQKKLCKDAVTSDGQSSCADYTNHFINVPDAAKTMANNDDEKSFLSGNHQEEYKYEQQELSEIDHNSQETPLPEAAIAPKHPDAKYLRRLARRKMRKTNPALFEQLVSISQT